ncbi:hypothetical protein MKW92_002361 [Papaver armeniacum]|nr:hypothetical protein MKW92_002361 [Papaver armeniacum]
MHQKSWPFYKKSPKTNAQASVDDRYTQWKSLVLFFTIGTNHNLVWPSLSCLGEWGPQLERQHLYLSEQTDGSVPNTLVIANCEVVKPRVAAAEHISQVLIWDVGAQPNRMLSSGLQNHDQICDFDGFMQILTGHQDNAEFALDMCPTEPFDPQNLQGLKHPLKLLVKKASESPCIGPRGIYQGHDDTVEDVQFCPSSTQEFCSVGDDSCLILWDARTGTSPTVKQSHDLDVFLGFSNRRVEKAHSADLHCVDWNRHDENLILTGSADNSVRMFDRRNLTADGVGAPIYKFEGHKAAVLCVQWCPDKASVFGSAAEDGFLNVWDHEKVGKKNERVGTRMPNSPPGLFFQHAGHRDKVVDFHWNTSDPWTIVSVSDDCESSGGGGTLQVNLLYIYRPEEEVLEELEKFKSHILACSSKS